MHITHYSQPAHDLAELIRTQASGETDKHEALDVLVSRVAEQVPTIAMDDVSNGLLKLADNMLLNPVTRGNPQAAVKAMDKDMLVNELAAVVQGTKWAAMQSGETPSWERKGR